LEEGARRGGPRARAARANANTSCKKKRTLLERLQDLLVVIRLLEALDGRQALLAVALLHADVHVLGLVGGLLRGRRGERVCFCCCCCCCLWWWAFFFGGGGGHGACEQQGGSRRRQLAGQGGRAGGRARSRAAKRPRHERPLSVSPRGRRARSAAAAAASGGGGDRALAPRRLVCSGARPPTGFGTGARAASRRWRVGATGRREEAPPCFVSGSPSARDGAPREKAKTKTRAKGVLLSARSVHAQTPRGIGAPPGAYTTVGACGRGEGQTATDGARARSRGAQARERESLTRPRPRRVRRRPPSAARPQCPPGRSLSCPWSCAPRGKQGATHQSRRRRREVPRSRSCTRSREREGEEGGVLGGFVAAARACVCV
jgi:hypothetical protein